MRELLGGQPSGNFHCTSSSSNGFNLQRRLVRYLARSSQSSIEPSRTSLNTQMGS
ncbi:hypothetical protein Sjap_026002 [Stephania japonica]|uniref:Uncharacterized protein n=1 Tax=Stephania japonica TaxID=461633 RepID=A0AAP0HIH0_9MAGN